ncbi:MAG: C39 family peptidase [Chloroflexota bacterium]
MMFQPPTPCYLSVPHIQQMYPGDCLAACAAMCLSYLGIRYRYQRLLRQLEVDVNEGAIFGNIQNLKMRGVSITKQEYGTWDDLYQILINGWPCILNVEARELPHWSQVTSAHAVVLVAIEENYVYINDPILPIGSARVSIGEMDLAWLEKNERYAVIYRS